MRFSNCLFFAIRLYCRRRRCGRRGFIVARCSKYYPGPHFMYARLRRDRSLQVVGFVPRYPKDRLLPPPLFDGIVKWGDEITQSV